MNIAKKYKPSTLTIVLSVAALFIMVFFFFVNPAHCVWAPKCVFKLITGLQCPGCGASRAIYALLHGRLWEAISYNYFLLLALPYLIAVMLVGWVPAWQKWQRVIQGEKLAWIYIVLCVIWWILRNILDI